jgi:hypothetical protein
MNRDGRDDEDTAPAWRSPRPSEPTRVGLGVIEGSRARSDTTDRDVGNGPPTPRSRVTADLAGADTSVVLEHINRAVDQRKREHEDLLQVVDDLADKVDALITDGRGDRAKLDGVRRELASLRAHAVRLVQRGEATAKELDELRGAMLTLAGQVGTLVELVGRPPQKLSALASQQEQLTAAELVELERGTGLAGVVGRLVANDSRIETRVGMVALVASTVPQVAIVLLASGRIDIVIGLVALFALAGLVLVLGRRVRRWWRSK